MFWHERHVEGLIVFLRIWFYVLYPLVKLLAYAAWCHWGAGLLDVAPGRSALKDGGIRFLIGVAFGGAVYLLAAALGPETLASIFERAGRGTVYAAVFTPIRWVEWWIMEHVMARRPESLLRVSRRTLYWRAGGILTSFASDVPLFLLVSFIGAIA